ncbi:hypothetical protein SDC9_156376 [bioreactor metagenome]|uniref:Uncharacterized protein n=1 Tax=bioreactor metagenome TaxID=1076179 RepID=A0A645F409_9ZZZZ
MAEQIAQVFQNRLGLGGFLAHQRHRAVERVEQKVRADACLQLGQARAGSGRRAAACAHLQCGHQGQRQQAARHGAGQARPFARVRQHPRQQRTGTQARQHPQQGAAQVLRGGGQAVEQPLQAAGAQQPAQRGGQGAAGDQRQAREPVQRRAGLEHHACRQHDFHEQHGAQHHADMAGVEDLHSLLLEGAFGQFCAGGRQGR